MNHLLAAGSVLGVPLWIVWLVIVIVAIVIEIETVNMTTIWFAAGALVALIMHVSGVDTALQIIAFVAVSLLGLAIFIGLVKPRLSKRTRADQATNADRIIDKEGIVTVRIDPVHGTGQILVIGQSWSARSLDNSVIEVGEKVLVRRFESVYAIVERY